VIRKREMPISPKAEATEAKRNFVIPFGWVVGSTLVGELGKSFSEYLTRELFLIHFHFIQVIISLIKVIVIRVQCRTRYYQYCCVGRVSVVFVVCNCGVSDISIVRSVSSVSDVSKKKSSFLSETKISVNCLHAGNLSAGIIICVTN